MANLSISRAWDETKARFATDGRLFAIVALALIAVPQAVAGTVAPPSLDGAASVSGPLLSVIAGLIGIAGQIALIRLALASASVGEAISHGFRRLPWAFLALVLFGVGIMLILVPLLLLMVGGEGLQRVTSGDEAAGAAAGAVLVIVVLTILLAARFQLIMPVATAEEGGPIHILKRSWNLSRGQYWKLLGFVFGVLIVAIFLLGATTMLAGIVAQGLFGDPEPMSLAALTLALVSAVAQAIFTAGVSVMLARIYAQLTSRAEVQSPSVPRSAD